MSDYGKKFTCFKCGCKFYDLHKPKAICPNPKCGVDQSEYKAPLLRSAAGKKAHAPRREEVIVEEEAIGIEDVGEFVEAELTEEAEEDLGFEGEEEEEPEDE